MPNTENSATQSVARDRPFDQEKLRVGQPFRPADLKGPDDKWLLFPPAILDRERGISNSVKRLYRALFDRAGKNSTCWPSAPKLAEDLGWCEKTVRNNMKPLVARGLIRRHWRKGRRSNTYEYIWDEIFERYSVTAQQTGRPGATARERYSSAGLSGNRVPPNSLRELSQGTSSPSSSQRNGTVTDGKPAAEPTTPQSEESETVRSNSGVWWTEDTLQEARKRLRCARYGGDTDQPVPDVLISTGILRKFTDEDDFVRWIEDLVERVPPHEAVRRVRNWGFYLADAESWPTRKQDLEHAVERRKASLCCHGERKGQCMSCRVDQWKRERIERQAAIKCPRCEDSGFVGMEHHGDWPTRYERCDCEAAKNISIEQIEQTNKGLKQHSEAAPAGEVSPPERCSKQPEVPSEDDCVVDSAVCPKCGDWVIIRANGNHKHCSCRGKGTAPNGESKSSEPSCKHVPDCGGQTEGTQPLPVSDQPVCGDTWPVMGDAGRKRVAGCGLTRVDWSVLSPVLRAPRRTTRDPIEYSSRPPPPRMSFPGTEVKMRELNAGGCGEMYARNVHKSPLRRFPIAQNRLKVEKMWRGKPINGDWQLCDLPDLDEQQVLIVLSMSQRMRRT